MNTENENRMNYSGIHHLAKDIFFNTDTWKSGTNNNVLVIGPTGAGKTRSYVRPNILYSHESMIVLDTKGNLHRDFADILSCKGYEVKLIDFTDLKKGNGYNPLSYIRYDAEKDLFSEQDILSLCSCIVDGLNSRDPYWDLAARQYLACLISYVLEALPEEEHDLVSVSKLLSMMSTDLFSRLMYELSMERPDSSAWLRYNLIKDIRNAEKMDSSIKGILSTNLDPLCFDDAQALYRKEEKIDFSVFADHKVALFLTISDTDRSLDKLANAFMTQALQQLCRIADHSPHERLRIPVRFYLDDFANSLFIPDFDKITSVIRSREISVSIMLQNLTQLISLYGEPRASTIINNCDKLLYLGGQDLTSAELIAKRANKTIDSILSMDLEDAYLFVRGEKPQKTKRYDGAKTDRDLLLWQDGLPFR
ncbi:MAG: type IV secretory system conjugative DNA transfer family protein [Erysipelotrichaceae bacterium]|nr:type IV secretory system conjugative DNA transfer family protein [Erysipelotrichaceae bacterium]